MTNTTIILSLTAVGHYPLARRGYSLNKRHLFDASTFWQAKGSQNLRGDKFSGSVLAVGKTDAYALLLRKKLSVS